VFIWGVLARTVLVWHVTWSVNSLTHVFGYRNYQTQDNSRNNWLVALLAHGEGWHNNHHAQQNAAAHGHHWWEWDLTYRTICALERIGLAKHVMRPPNGYTGSKGPARN
jgi:stearoyl-CoA desaturase (delta-9 desaturase)